MIYLITAFKCVVGVIFLIFIVGIVIGGLMVIVVDYEWLEEKARIESDKQWKKVNNR